MKKKKVSNTYYYGIHSGMMIPGCLGRYTVECKYIIKLESFVMKCLGNGLVKTGDQSSHLNLWNVQNLGAMLLMKGKISINYIKLLNQNHFRNYFNTTSMFDAVVFHERNWDLKDLPKSTSRLVQQVYIHFNLESPIWAQSLSLAPYIKG